MQDDTYETSEIIKELDTYDNSDNIKNDENNDIRTILDKSWANFGNLFKYQPLKKVRDYFGEYVGLYFSFSGALVASLWIPSLIGVIFFFLEIWNQYANFKCLINGLKNIKLIFFNFSYAIYNDNLNDTYTFVYLFIEFLLALLLYFKFLLKKRN
jgi:hypothetical protein